MTYKNTQQKIVPSFNGGVEKRVTFFIEMCNVVLLVTILRRESEMALCFNLIALILLDR